MALLDTVLSTKRSAGIGGNENRQRRLSLLDHPLVGIVFPVMLLVGWEFLLHAGLIGGRLMPPPSRILSTVRELAASGDLPIHVWVTLKRVLFGFALGAVAGTVLGALTGFLPRLARFLDPTLQALRAIPSIAWVPLFILWFGIFEASKIALIGVGVFFPVYLGVYGAVVGVDRRIVEVGRVYRLSGFELVRRILLPSILPGYVLALRSGLGLGWMFVVAAEFMGASEGLGYLLVDGQQLGKPDQIIAAILIFAIVGKATDSLLMLAASPFLRWQDTHGGRL
jgi:sulfonate transport system permease protein